MKCAYREGLRTVERGGTVSLFAIDEAVSPMPEDSDPLFVIAFRLCSSYFCVSQASSSQNRWYVFPAYLDMHKLVFNISDYCFDCFVYFSMCRSRTERIY